MGSVPEDNPGYSYEEICEIYPHKYASRTTLITILNEGVENNFFEKKIKKCEKKILKLQEW